MAQQPLSAADIGDSEPPELPMPDLEAVQQAVTSQNATDEEPTPAAAGPHLLVTVRAIVGGLMRVMRATSSHGSGTDEIVSRLTALSRGLHDSCVKVAKLKAGTTEYHGIDVALQKALAYAINNRTPFAEDGNTIDASEMVVASPCTRQRKGGIRSWAQAALHYYHPEASATSVNAQRLADKLAQIRSLVLASRDFEAMFAQVEALYESLAQQTAPTEVFADSDRDSDHDGQNGRRQQQQRPDHNPDENDTSRGHPCMSTKEHKEDSHSADGKRQRQQRFLPLAAEFTPDNKERKELTLNEQRLKTILNQGMTHQATMPIVLPVGRQTDDSHLSSADVDEATRSKSQARMLQDLMALAAPDWQPADGVQIAAFEKLQAAGCNMAAQGSDGRTALMATIYGGHLEAARWLVEKGGAKLELRDFEGNTAFLIACYAGRLEMLKMLEAAGYDVTEQLVPGRHFMQHTGLHVLAMLGHSIALKWLLDVSTGTLIEARDCQGNTPFLMACAGQTDGHHVECMQQLIDAGCNTTATNDEGITALELARASRQAQRAVQLLESLAMKERRQHRSAGLGSLVYIPGEWPRLAGRPLNELFVNACGNGNLQAMDSVLNMCLPAGTMFSRSDLMVAKTASNRTGLMAAARNGHVEAMQFVLDRSNRAELDAQDTAGTTAFVYACQAGHTGCLELLCHAGCDTIVKTNCCRSGLIEAARHGRFATLQWLLARECGGTLEDRDDEGGTPFLHACGYGDSDCMALLRAAGCEVSVTTDKGTSGLMVAASQGHAAALQWLVQNCEQLDMEARIKPTNDTAFLLACFKGHVDCMKMLIDAKCDTSATNTSGQNAIALAQCSGSSKALKLLRNHSQMKARAAEPNCSVDVIQTGEPEPESHTSSQTNEEDTTSDESHECFICLEGADAGILMRGCACRGGAGFVHLSCLVTAAKANEKTWDKCPTCKQSWTGQLELGLAQAHVELTASLPEIDYIRLRAATSLVVALKNSGQLDEALQLGLAALETMQEVIVDWYDLPEDSRMPGLVLQTMGIIGTVFGLLGDHKAALPLQTERVLRSRGLLGDDNPGTLVAISELGRTHMKMGSYATALPLMQEAVKRARYVNGIDNAETLGFIKNLGTLHGEMGNTQLALPLLTEVFETKQRVLGSHNQETLDSLGNLGVLKHNLGDFSAAMPLLEKAVAGLILKCGGGHRSTRYFQAKLDDLRRDMRNPQHVAQAAAHLRQQRIQTQPWYTEWIGPVAKPVVCANLITAKPELNGREVVVLKFKRDKQCYIVLIRAVADEPPRKSQCKPTSLRLAVGTNVIAVGLIGSPELNGRSGVIEGFDEERGRYCTRLDGRTTVARLKPSNCRAVVQGSTPM